MPPPRLQRLAALGSSLLLLLLCGCAAAAADSAQQCAAGNVACWCKGFGSEFLQSPSTMCLQLCRLSVTHAGKQRTVDVFLPAGISSSSRLTPVVHLHGVAKGDWFVAAFPAWRTLRNNTPIPLAGVSEAFSMGVLMGTDGASASSGGVSSGGCAKGGGAGLVADGRTVLIVPEALGTPEQGQMWATKFWPCMKDLGRCADSSADDVGFLAALLEKLPALLAGLPLSPGGGVKLSGYSNGGMLVQALLCERPELARRLSGVAIVSSTLGADYAAQRCGRPLPASPPLLVLHGRQDATLPYANGTSEGVAVLGAPSLSRLWAQRLGCKPAAGGAAAAAALHSDGTMSCSDVCQQPRRVVLCSAGGAGHSLFRELPRGYVAGLMRWGLGGFAGQPAVPQPATPSG